MAYDNKLFSDLINTDEMSFRKHLPAFEELLSRALSLVACGVLSVLKIERIYVNRSLLENENGYASLCGI